MRPAGRRAFAHVWSIDRRSDDAQPVGSVDARFRADGVSLTFVAWPA